MKSTKGATFIVTLKQRRTQNFYLVHIHIIKKQSWHNFFEAKKNIEILLMHTHYKEIVIAYSFLEAKKNTEFLLSAYTL